MNKIQILQDNNNVIFQSGKIKPVIEEENLVRLVDLKFKFHKNDKILVRFRFQKLYKMHLFNP